MRKVILTCLSVITWLFFVDTEVRNVVIIALEAFLLFYVLDRIGSKFVFLEILALASCTQLLFAPVMAEKMGFDLSVPYDTYFNYALPATIAFILGLLVPFFNQRLTDKKVGIVIENLSITFRNRKNWGILLMLVGFPFWVFQNEVSAGLNFIFYLLSQLLFIGISLLIFTQFKFKWIFISLGILLLIVTTLLNGMVGTVLFWLFTIGVLYTCYQKMQIPFWAKLTFVLVGVWILAILQIAKSEYRVQTWSISKSEVSSRVEREINQDPGLLVELIVDRISDPASILNVESNLALISRLNQGGLVTMTMDYIPQRRSFAHGEATFKNTFTAFIPRILWPAKPVVGQHEYFKKFTGVQLGKFHSATLGPLGDAYADFGKFGIIFLGLFGLFISRLFMFFINKSLSTPGLLLWFIGIYFTSLTVSEISVAVYINAIFKFLIFIFITRFLLRTFLHIRI